MFVKKTTPYSLANQMPSGPFPPQQIVREDICADLTEHVLNVVDIGRQNQALWAPHLEKNRMGILKAAKMTQKKDRCIILGAGPCYDVPLPEIAEQFREVILVDINEKAMNLAISGLPGDKARKVIPHVAELTGCIPDLLFLMRKELHQASESGASFETTIRGLSTIIMQQSIAEIGLTSFHGDLIVSDMVLSQLNMSLALAMSWIHHTYQTPQTPPLTIPEWREASFQLCTRLVSSHLRGLLSKKGSVVFLSSDLAKAESLEQILDLRHIMQEKKFTLPLREFLNIQAQAPWYDSWTWTNSIIPPKFFLIMACAFRPEEIMPMDPLCQGGR